MSLQSPRGHAQSPRTPLRNQLTPRRSLLQARHLNKTITKLPPVIKTGHTVLENFGLPLPVLITETLTFADNNANLSARLSPEGWGWVVSGRRLLVWQYRENRQRNIHTSPVSCYELTLAQTDLAHKADLVCVYTPEGAQVPSCIAVSPEGSVRYWSSIAHEGGYIEESADLHGQECDMLIDVNPTGCVLATTTCTVVLVQPTTTAGRHGVSIRTLRGSGGWLGGIGRRVSSLFFSAMPSSQSVETKLVGITPLGQGSTEELQKVCVVAGSHIQIWELGTPERIITEVDLQKNLRDAYLHSHAFAPGDPALLDIHIFDIQYWNDSLLLLTAASNSMRSPPIRYALVQICIDEEIGAGQIINFVTLHRYIFDGNLHQSGGEVGSHGLKIIATGNTAILYESSNIAVTSCVTSNDVVDVINFFTNSDKVLGGGLCFGTPLLFSKTHGVLSVSLIDSMLNENSLIDSPLASPRQSDMFDGQLSFYELDPKSVVDARDISIRGSTAELIKAAFLHHIRREFQSSKILLNDIFPPNNEITDVDTLLDRNILAIATDLVNDVPASDPRWSKSFSNNSGAALGSSASLQILLQLQDKRRALSLLYEFLKVSGLWFRLGGASDAFSNVGPIPTMLHLRALAEKLTAAITLRTIQQQSQYQTIIDTVIQQVLSNSDDEEEERGMTSSILSPSDLFYKSVSRIERGLITAMQWCSHQNDSEGATSMLTQLISKVNHVVLATLQEVSKYRQQNAESYPLSLAVNKLRLEHTTWTSSPHSNSLQHALQRQHSISIQRARYATTELKAMLKAQAAELASILLEFAFERIEGFPLDSRRREVAMKDFTNIRSEMMQPFVDDEDYDHAMSLAEKFHDFDVLVLVCEQSNNRDKLYYYMEKFKLMGFQQCAFRWFMVRGRGGQASLLKAFPQYGDALAQWLSEQETEYPVEEKDMEEISENVKNANEPAITIDGSELLWLHKLIAEKWKDASQTLIQLAETELESVNRMTTQASLAKLCALAAEVDGPNDEEIVKKTITRANQRLTLAEHHTLPQSLLTFHGLDPDNLKVMEPREIIDMFIISSGKGIVEYDYCRALSLCDMVTDNEDEESGKSEIQDLRHRLWCSIILRDTWNEYNKNSPLSTVREKMFFKVVDTAHLLDCNLDDYLPSLEDILSSAVLSEISNDECFQYIMKVGYEHIYRTYFTERMAID